MIYCFQGRLSNNHMHYKKPKQISRDGSFITISTRLHDCNYKQGKTGRKKYKKLQRNGSRTNHKSVLKKIWLNY